jgi:hypothetical protein
MLGLTGRVRVRILEGSKALKSSFPDSLAVSPWEHLASFPTWVGSHPGTLALRGPCQASAPGLFGGAGGRFRASARRAQFAAFVTCRPVGFRGPSGLVGSSERWSLLQQFAHTPVSP